MQGEGTKLRRMPGMPSNRSIMVKVSKGSQSPHREGIQSELSRIGA